MAKKAASTPVQLDASQRLLVFCGQERFLIEEYTRQFTQILDEKFGGVEVFHFDGETVEPAVVLDEIRSYGLMQRHKLVILDNADSFLAGGGKNATEEDDDEAAADGAGDDAEEDKERSSRRPLMERYAEKPVPDATLLMRARTWRPGKLDKLIAKTGAVFKCEPVTEASAATWCRNRCARKYQTTLDPAAATLLVQRVGTELLHLDMELMKLAAMAGGLGGSGGGGGGRVGGITRELVEESIGLSREEKVWEIQGAIATGDATSMLRKLRELIDVSHHDEVPLMWGVVDLMRKLHAASQLLRRNVPAQAVIGRAKLWSSTHGTTDAMLEAARRHPPMVFAQLLQLAIEADQRGKTGVGDQQRGLEGLLVTIADTLTPQRAAGR